MTERSESRASPPFAEAWRNSRTGESASRMRYALHRSAERVQRDQPRWQNYALSADEVERVLDRLVEVLERAELESHTPGDNAGERALEQRLLTLLRRELLGFDREALNGEELLTLIRRIDVLDERLRPSGHDSLTSVLLGATARDLVVEIAHDLRSPLNSIMFLADTLRKGQSGEVNDTQRQQLGIVYSASLSLIGIASDLIDLGRENDFVAAPVEAEVFSLREIMDSIRAVVAPVAHEKRLNIHCHTPDRDLRMGSPIRLSRVLLNLTTNGLKFTESGEIEMLAIERGSQRIEFSVRDTGRGMDRETIENLYEPFTRSESRTGFHFSGTGLGLAMCRRLVDLMGGELQVESRPGYGTRFFFELDLPPAPRV